MWCGRGREERDSRRFSRVSGFFLLLLLVVATEGAAQVPPSDPVPADTVPVDTSPADTVPDAAPADEPLADPAPADALRDTAPADTVPDAAPADEPAADPAPADTAPADTVPDTAPADAVTEIPADTLVADTLAADSTAVAAPQSAAADSAFQALRTLPGFLVTEYEGERANYRTATGLLRLEGSASVTREGDRLTADTILYRQRDQLVEAYGSPEVQGDAQTLRSERLLYDLSTRRATALGARTEVSEAAVTWFVRGDMAVEGSSRMFGRHASFTSCDLEIPHYHFESDQIMVIRDRILVARPARLYFGNVPVMWLPFVVQDLEQGRRSGLLTPRFGVNDIVRTSSGYNRQVSNVGFYWAINDYMGAEVSGTWRSGAYSSLLGTLTYNWRRQFLNGTVSTERYWRATGGREIALNAQSSWRPDEVTSLSLSGRYASSSQFVRESSYDPREVTQDMNSSLSMSRQFGWGSISMGGNRRQSISTGDVSMTLPNFSISPRSITLFPSSTPETARWYNDITFNPSSVTGSHASSDYADNALSRRQDQNVTQFRASPSLSIGNLSLSTSGNFNRTQLQEAVVLDQNEEQFELRGYTREETNWSASAAYRQTLIGSTSISPAISLNQVVRRDTLTNDRHVSGPMRFSFGASVNTDLYGFYPGFANFTSVRHKISPFISYRYAPAVEQTALQETVFGQAGGRTQNAVTLGMNQTWEAKLRTPRAPEEPIIQVDSITGDTIPQSRVPSVPNDPQKVTLLSLTTSAFDYDFARAKAEGSGFTTNFVSNTVRSDYLRGLTIQMRHELFDRRDLEPTSANTGRLGRFAPRLSSLSTGFQLGPESAVFQWLDRLGFGASREEEESPGILPGAPESDDPVPAGQGGATGNPQGMGSGPWRASLSYNFSRPTRNFTGGSPLPDEATQTVDGNMSFQLTPNWGVSWNTSYSLSDREFGSHRLNFTRDIHEWQANFSFYQAPNGNTAFEFFVQLLHNTDLRFDYAERNLGIDRPAR